MSGDPNMYRDRWFVDLDGKVIGPFTASDIIHDLIDHKLSVGQRISFDGKVWAAICNTPQFEQALQGLLSALSAQTSEDGDRAGIKADGQFGEVSQIENVDKLTEGISEQLDHARHLEEMVAKTQKINGILKEIKIKKKTVHHAKERVDETVHPDDDDVFVPAPTKKTSLADLFKGSDTRRSRIVYATLAVLIAIGGGLEYWNYMQEKKQRELAVQQLLAAKQARLAGEYGKAISTFQAIRDQKTLESMTTEELLEMADTHAQGNDADGSTRLIEQVLARSTDPNEIARAYALSATLALNNKQIDKAADSYEKSIQKTPLYPALHNLASIRIRQKRFEEAESLLLKAISMPQSASAPERAASLFALLEVAVELDRVDRMKSPETTENRRLGVVRELFAKAAGGTSTHAAELKLGQVYLESEDEKQDSAQVFALEFIDLPRTPKQTPSANPKPAVISSVDQRVDSSNIEWTSLYKNCVSIYNKDRSREINAAFYAACLARTHGSEAAISFASFAHRKRPDDPIYSGLLGSLLFETKRVDEALRVLMGNFERLEVSSRTGWNTLTAICNEQAKTDHLSAECQAVRTPASERPEHGISAPGLIPAAPSP